MSNTAEARPVAANEHQGSMKCQENRDRRKMPTNPGDMLQGHNFNQSRKL